MTDRLKYQVGGEYSLRSDYDLRRTAALHEPAIEGFEELLAYQSGLLKYSYVDGVTRRELCVVGIENEPDEAVLFSDLTQLEVRRHPVQTEIAAVVTDYRHGVLRHMAQLTVRQFVANSAPFIHEYSFEVYAGGGRQATVAVTDVINGQGLDTWPMTPYDYGQLIKHIDQAASMTAVLGVPAGLEEGGER